MSSPEIINDKRVKIEESKLAPGEVNWFKVLTSAKFVIRFAIVLVVVIVCSLIILNVTLDPDSKAWYNTIHKPDWMPDGIISVIIFAFVSALLVWMWYRLDDVLEGYWKWALNVWVVVILVLQFVWTLMLYKNQNLTVARYLVCFYLGFVALLFIFGFWYMGFSDISLYGFIYTGWLVIVLCYTFGMHDLSKEYALLGIVKDTNSSLYKKKLKMEVVEGIKITEDGQRIEFMADEQE
jgi:tryptophan-rich sensory protein